MCCSNNLYSFCYIAGAVCATILNTGDKFPSVSHLCSSSSCAFFMHSAMTTMRSNDFFTKSLSDSHNIVSTKLHIGYTTYKWFSWGVPSLLEGKSRRSLRSMQLCAEYSQRSATFASFPGPAQLSVACCSICVNFSGTSGKFCVN